MTDLYEGSDERSRSAEVGKFVDQLSDAEGHCPWSYWHIKGASNLLKYVQQFM